MRKGYELYQDLNKMDAPLCEAVYGPLSSTTSVYAVWTKPSKQLNKFSRFDLVVDRCYLRYKMYFRDIIDKPVKSRMLKIQLIEITVDDFINFVTKQIEIANE